MTFIAGYKKHEYYICCSTAKRYKKELNLCQRKYTKETEVEEKIKNILKQITDQYINKKHIEKNVGVGLDLPNYNKIIKTLQNKVDNYKQITLNLYKDKVKGIITESQFLELLEETNQEKEKYITEIQELNKKLKESNSETKQNEIIKNVIERTLNYEEIDKTTIGALISKIIINLDGSMEVQFKFKEQIKTNV